MVPGLQEGPMNLNSVLHSAVVVNHACCSRLGIIESSKSFTIRGIMYHQHFWADYNDCKISSLNVTKSRGEFCREYRPYLEMKTTLTILKTTLKIYSYAFSDLSFLLRILIS